MNRINYLTTFFLIVLFVMMSTSNYINAQSQMNIKKQNLATIAALEARGDLKRLEPAINQALDNGLTVNQVKDGKPEQVVNDVQRILEEYIGEGEQFDDMTMLCLEYIGI